MTDIERDDEIRAWFAEARRAESAWVPSFERVLGGRPAPRRRRGIPWLLATMGAATVVAIALLRDPTPSGQELAMPPVELRSATDFLLDMASAHSAGAVPRIGDSRDWFDLPGIDEDTPS
ncbi:MAG: hypothetical protein FJ206_01230 [Gemmatimonadetes bacterium]|nr:hypothetical protein [Gemmatimonadota bacterium]